MEELVAMIQGGRHDLIEELWMQLRDLVALYAQRYYKKLIKFDGTAFGCVDVDDLIQSGYLAVVAAVADYDSTKGASFTTYLYFHIKKEFRSAIGRSGRQLRDPLNHAMSLDVPLNEDDPDSMTRLDFVPDLRDDIADADEKIFQEQLHDALEKALNTLPSNQAQAIRSEYLEGCTLQETADKIGCSTIESVRCLCQAGMQRIRNSSEGKKLEQFLDRNINYYNGTGLSTFVRTNTSQVERMVMQRERYRKKYEMIFRSTE